jgi:hypothetical protein
MATDWIAKDEIDERGALGRYRVRASLDEEGLELTREEQATRATWSDVLGVIVLGTSAYVLVPREPPRPPWIEVRLSMLDPSLKGGGVAGFAGRVRERVGQRGYRDAKPRAPAMDAATLMSRVMEKRAIRGALEVPIGRGAQDTRSDAKRLVDSGIGAGTGGAGGGYVGMLFGAIAAGGIGLPIEAGAWAGAVLGGLGAAALGGVLGFRRLRTSLRGRVMVLTPDGCVIGFPGGPRAFAWSELQSFRIDREDGHAFLVVCGADGEMLGRIDGLWFGAPLELIHAVAEAYRARQG